MQMLIKVKKNSKDLMEFCPTQAKHRVELSRREYIKGAAAASLISTFVPESVLRSVANAAELVCPAPVREIGAIAQIYASGGSTVSARWISDQQAAAAAANAGMARNYGIDATTLIRLGPNVNIAGNSPFGFALLQGPPGYAGGPAAWRTNVLSKLSSGAHMGPFNQDDNQNTGIVGGASPYKPSLMGKDLKIQAGGALATWANGLPSASAGNLNNANSPFINTFSLTPAATGLINSNAMTAASAASASLADAMSAVLKTNERKGAAELRNSAGCGLLGNSQLADPAYGANLFNANNIAALSGRMTLAQLTNTERNLLAAYYQSAMGVAGAVVEQLGGRDYHNQDPQGNIGPRSIEEARHIVMFLAACEAANAPGALIYSSDGFAISIGTTTTNFTVNGVANNAIQTQTADGDAGGTYNAGLVLFYHPNGTVPQANFTGTLDATTGRVRTDPNVASSREGFAGLYLSALKFIRNGNIPAAALAKVKAAGLKGTATVF